MDYCTAEDVEGVLREELAESFDVLVARCISTGSGLVDGFLKVKSLVVPVVMPVLVPSYGLLPKAVINPEPSPIEPLTMGYFYNLTFSKYF